MTDYRSLFKNTQWWRALVVVLALAVCAVAPALAQSDQRHPELVKFVKEGGSVEFLGNAYGLDGWILVRDGAQPRTVYTTPAGAMVMGVLVNPQGEVETAKQLVAFRERLRDPAQAQTAAPGAEKSFSAPAERFYAALEQAHFRAVGSADAPYMYVIFNVTCGTCQNYWKRLKPEVAAGRLQLRLVPFGRQPENRDAGAALLAVKDPASAWDAFIGGDTSALAATHATPETQREMAQNNDLLATWKLSVSPPMTVYKRVADGQVMAVNGTPDNVMLIFADLVE